MNKQKQKAKEKKKEIVILTRPERQRLLKELFKKCLGIENEITRIDIFTYLYGDPSNYKDLELFYLWSKIKLEMNWIRRTTKYFIASRMSTTGQWFYFIVVDEKDAEFYISNLKNTQKRINYMINKCRRAVKEKYYKEL